MRTPLPTRTSVPILGADGRSILFMSLAQDLIAKDFNGRRDVFILRLGSDDSDHDGLDDDWEWAYFSTLARDGAGDFDGDGASDLAEFRAGTDPTNQGSVFRVLTISRMGTDQVNLVWQSVPGKVYQVQYRDISLASGWINVAGTVTAQEFSAGKSVVRNSQDRFFRVVLSE